VWRTWHIARIATQHKHRENNDHDGHLRSRHRHVFTRRVVPWCVVSCFWLFHDMCPTQLTCALFLLRCLRVAPLRLFVVAEESSGMPDYVVSVVALRRWVIGGSGCASYDPSGAADQSIQYNRVHR